MIIRFLSTLNKAYYEYQYRHTLPFTEDRDKIVYLYVKRCRILDNLQKKYKKL